MNELLLVVHFAFKKIEFYAWIPKKMCCLLIDGVDDDLIGISEAIEWTCEAFLIERKRNVFTKRFVAHRTFHFTHIVTFDRNGNALCDPKIPFWQCFINFFTSKLHISIVNTTDMTFFTSRFRWLSNNFGNTWCGCFLINIGICICLTYWTI